MGLSPRNVVVVIDQGCRKSDAGGLAPVTATCSRTTARTVLGWRSAAAAARHPRSVCRGSRRVRAQRSPPPPCPSAAPLDRHWRTAHPPTSMNTIRSGDITAGWFSVLKPGQQILVLVDDLQRRPGCAGDGLTTPTSNPPAVTSERARSRRLRAPDRRGSRQTASTGALEAASASRRHAPSARARVVVPASAVRRIVLPSIAQNAIPASSVKSFDEIASRTLASASSGSPAAEPQLDLGVGEGDRPDRDAVNRECRLRKLRHGPRRAGGVEDRDPA